MSPVRAQNKFGTVDKFGQRYFSSVSNISLEVLSSDWSKCLKKCLFCLGDFTLLIKKSSKLKVCPEKLSSWPDIVH